MGLFDRIKRAFTGEDVTQEPVNEEKRIVIDKFDKGMEKTRRSFSDKLRTKEEAPPSSCLIAARCCSRVSD